MTKSRKYEKYLKTNIGAVWPISCDHKLKTCMILSKTLTWQQNWPIFAKLGKRELRNTLILSCGHSYTFDDVLFTNCHDCHHHTYSLSVLINAKWQNDKWAGWNWFETFYKLALGV